MIIHQASTLAQLLLRKSCKQRTNCYKAPHAHVYKFACCSNCVPSRVPTFTDTTQARRECSVRPPNRRVFRVAGGGRGGRPSILFAQGFPCVWLRVRLMKSSF